LLPFSHTTLPKKEWKDDNQEKKGRVINLGDVLRSFDEKAAEDYESDSDVSSVPTEFYMSDNSSDDEERWKEKYYEDDGGADMDKHMKDLLPEKAVVGKPAPKLVKPPPPPKKNNGGPGFFGRQWKAFQEWKVAERKRRMHYVYRDYYDKIEEYDRKYKEEILLEIEEHKRAVIKEAYAIKKRIKVNSSIARKKENDTEEYNVKVKVRDRENEIINFYTANLQRWAVEKHDHKIELEELQVRDFCLILLISILYYMLISVFPCCTFSSQIHTNPFHSLSTIQSTATAT